VQVAHPQLGEVVQPLRERLERAAEAVGVGDVADGPGLLVPARLDLAAPVGLAQLRGPVRGGGEREPDQPPDEHVLTVGAVVVAVERLERAVHVEEPHVEAGEEADGLGPPQRPLGLVGEHGTQPLQGCRGASTAIGVGALRDHAHILPSRGRRRDVVTALVPARWEREPSRSVYRQVGEGTALP
jgi:hypothetical protein